LAGFGSRFNRTLGGLAEDAEAEQPNNDQINGDEIVQETRDDQDKDPHDKCENGGNISHGYLHDGLLGTENRE
jgi:hypothetical protein